MVAVNILTCVEIPYFNIHVHIPGEVSQAKHVTVLLHYHLQGCIQYHLFSKSKNQDRSYKKRRPKYLKVMTLSTCAPFSSSGVLGNNGFLVLKMAILAF